VNPTIATMLMVAATVLLATILYVTVSWFMGAGP